MGVALMSELGFPGCRRCRWISRAGTPSHATWALSLTEISRCLWCVPSLGVSGPKHLLRHPTWVPLSNDHDVELSLCVISVETVYSPKGFLCMPGFIEHLVRTKKGQCRYPQVGHDPALSHPQSGCKGPPHLMGSSLKPSPLCSLLPQLSYL